LGSGLSVHLSVHLPVHLPMSYLTDRSTEEDNSTRWVGNRVRLPATLS